MGVELDKDIPDTPSFSGSAVTSGSGIATFEVPAGRFAKVPIVSASIVIDNAGIYDIQVTSKTTRLTPWHLSHHLNEEKCNE